MLQIVKKVKMTVDGLEWRLDWRLRQWWRWPLWRWRGLWKCDEQHEVSDGQSSARESEVEGVGDEKCESKGKEGRLKQRGEWMERRKVDREISLSQAQRLGRGPNSYRKIQVLSSQGLPMQTAPEKTIPAYKDQTLKPHTRPAAEVCERSEGGMCTNTSIHKGYSHSWNAHLAIFYWPTQISLSRTCIPWLYVVFVVLACVYWMLAKCVGTRRVNMCCLRAIKSIQGRFQVKRHSCARAPGPPVSLRVILKNWEWPGDEATFVARWEVKYFICGFKVKSMQEF